MGVCLEDREGGSLSGGWETVWRIGRVGVCLEDREGGSLSGG